jgi:endonuclease/exonuclease/phosphatase family metal-dependent hydrolase
MKLMNTDTQKAPEGQRIKKEQAFLTVFPELRVMTYNVHSCIGRDRKTSVQRIAGVIHRDHPDIIALQELDSGLSRSGFVDQARWIAEYLKMECHFHPSFQVEQGFYGNAVLSRYPLRLVQAGELPTLPGRSRLEKRGAVWTEIDIRGSRIQFLNTHLGLNRKERLVQAEALLSSRWLKHPDCRPPVILCGDLNAFRGSAVYRRFHSHLADALIGANHRGILKTWPSLFPLVLLDYIFVTRDVIVREVRAPRNPLAVSASDHLPLVIECRLSPPANAGD